MISVCLASYNGALYIQQQVVSILVNLTASDELIVSDDGSTDATCDIIQAFNDSRIKLLQGPGQGLVKNFEHALHHAKGDIIFLADQDDIWHRDKVQRMTAEIRKGYTLVLSDCQIVDEVGNEISSSFYTVNGSKPGLIKNIIKNSYLGCALAFRRELLKKALPFPEKVSMHDWWLGLVAECTGTTSFLPDKLISYRRHGKNVSPTGEKSKNSLLKKIHYRVSILVALLQRYFKLHFFKKFPSNQ